MYNLILDIAPGKRKIKKFICFTTVLLYDANKMILPVSENQKINPTNPYSASKAAAEIIINKLKALGARIKIYDPYYKGSQVFGISVEQNIEDVLSKVDASIIITAHKEFQEINPKIFTKMKTPILIDSRGIIDISSANSAGLVFRGLGRSV